MKRLIITILGFCILLTGCSSLFDGSYVSVTPHENRSPKTGAQTYAANYEQLYTALKKMVTNSDTKHSITIKDFPKDKLNTDIKKATDNLVKNDPIANYCVDSINWKVLNGAVLNVDITYTHPQSELRQMRRVTNVAQAEEALCAAMNRCDTDLLLLVDTYTETDFVVLAENYAIRNPHWVMEMPKITVNLYPSDGKSRVVELNFSYQSNRTMLRSMQSQVQPIFESAALYVSGNAEDSVKYSQLYSFLTERYEYKLERSITPAYSLLCHGVGDSRAFASVYAAMCREAGLFCRVVSGTYQGNRRYWNMVCDNDTYYHVDLLKGSFMECTDEEMGDYVWDYSAYSSNGVHTQ